MASAHARTQDVNTTRSASSKDLIQTASLASLNDFCPTICVICLERVQETAKALPCKHDQFHFACLGTWLQQSIACPLCKSEVNSISYCDGNDKNVYYVPQKSQTTPQSRRLPRRPRRRQAACGSAEDVQAIDPALAFRKHVYDAQLYSLYIGSNRISKYRNITPDLIDAERALTAKAKKWIRRELGIFDFLKPDSPAFGRADRRATNAEFLLEYIVAILKVIDIKGSAGQAVELLKEFLGLGNARLFLHELENWLRSPCDNLSDWDQVVQYAQR